MLKSTNPYRIASMQSFRRVRCIVRDQRLAAAALFIVPPLYIMRVIEHFTRIGRFIRHLTLSSATTNARLAGPASQSRAAARRRWWQQ
jgi:hypothetical protein